MAGNATFGDPTLNVPKELDVQGGDVSAFKVDGTQLIKPKTLTDLFVTPKLAMSTTGRSYRLWPHANTAMAARAIAQLRRHLAR